MRKQIFHLLTLIFLSITTQAQTPERNLKKYWNYRDKFQKHFVVIGKEQGKSLNVSNIDNQPLNIGSWPNTIGTGTGGSLHGYKRWGDVGVQQGEYIGVLASQYRLLKDEGKDVRSTLNELYYAIEAINRLDKFAEPYFSSFAAPSSNGFFLRDDVPKIMTDHWENEFTKTGDARDLYEGVHSDYYVDTDPGEGNVRNEESQDQMIGLMLGMAYVVKLVEATEFVQPTPTDAGFNIVSEAKAITTRMMNQLVQLRILNDSNDPAELNGGFCDVTTNWLLVNPVTGQKVDRGDDARNFSYGFAKAAEEITGNTYSGFNVIHKAEEITGDGHICLGPHNVLIPLTNIDAVFWNTFENANIGPGDINASIPPISFTYSYPDLTTFPPGTATNTLSWEGMDLHIGNPIPDFNVNLALSLATIGKTWSHANVNRWADDWHMWIFDLAYSVLHNETPLQSKAFYESLLDSAPDDCIGPHNFNIFSANPIDNLPENQNPFLYSGGWNENSRWGHPFGPSKFTRGEFNGNDYMLLYNLYQLAFKNTGTLPAYVENSCQCESSKKLQAATSSNLLVANTILQRKFSNYLDFEVRTKEFLIEDLAVQSGKQLTVETDLIVCNPTGGNTTLFTQLNGFIRVGNVSGIASSIVVRKGNTLRIGNNGKVFVYNNSSILIEEGATLIIDQGAKIQLLGDNAVLEIKGDLKLNPNAIFTFTHPGTTSGYVKFSRETPWDNQPHIFGSLGSAFELKGQNKNDKILEVAQDIVDISQLQNISSFKIQTGLVEFTSPGKSYISTDAPTRLVASKFISSGSADGRVAVWGQSVCEISNSLFDKVPLEGYLFMNGHKLTVSYTEMMNSNTALGIQGMGVNLNHTNFHHNETGLASNLMTQNSLATEAKFNDNSFGASIWGSPIEMMFNSCMIKNNGSFGIDLSGPTKAKVRCGEINKNFIGLSIASDASLSMNTTNGGGYVDAQNNLENTILLNNASNIDLNNGYNDLRIKTGPGAVYPNNIYSQTTCTNFANCPTDISGTMLQSTPAPVTANNNKWQPPTVIGGLVSYPSLTATSSEDKFTEVISTSDGITKIHFTDAAQAERAPCGFWDPAPCPTCTPSYLELCPDCNIINTPVFIGKRTNEAVKEAILNMDSTIVNGHKYAVDLFHQVLKYPIVVPTEGDLYVTKIAEREMLVSLAQSIESEQVYVSDTTVAPEVNKAIEIQDDKIDRAESQNNYLDKLYGSIEKALIHYSAQRGQEAIYILDNVLSFVHPEDLDYVSYLRCKIYTEERLKLNQINKIEFLNEIATCTPPSRTIVRTMNVVTDKEPYEPANEVSVYPNPSSGEIFMEYDLEETLDAKLIICDLSGKTIYERTLTGGRKKEEVKSLRLANGVYLYKVLKNGDLIKSDKLIIIH